MWDLIEKAQDILHAKATAYSPDDTTKTKERVFSNLKDAM